MDVQDKYPLHIQPKTLTTWSPKLPSDVKLVDIDGDSFIEAFCSFEDGLYFALFDLDGNHAGWQLPLDRTFRSFSCIDIDDDGKSETFITIVEKDSAYILMYEYKENRPSYRIVPDSIPSTYRTDRWDGDFIIENVMDIDQDGEKEIVIMAKAGYDLWPRGIYVCDLDSKELVWNFPMGTVPYEMKIEDIDDDGIPEILIGTAAVSNDVLVNGTADSLSYFIVLNNRGEPRLISSLGYYASDVRDIHVCDIDQDQENELIVLRREQTSERPSTIFVFNSISLDMKEKHSGTLLVTNIPTLCYKLFFQFVCTPFSCG